MKINIMSSNIVNIMKSLSNNDVLVNLLSIDKSSTSFDDNSNRPSGLKRNIQIINQNDEHCRISPVPFNPDATDKDKSMIRVYYNTGEFDSEIISESVLHIDIIVAKSLWLSYDNEKQSEVIRPYAIMEHIMDCVGRRGYDPLISINFTGYQHLAVNTKFDAIRLYAEYFKPEV